MYKLDSPIIIVINMNMYILHVFTDSTVLSLFQYQMVVGGHEAEAVHLYDQLPLDELIAQDGCSTMCDEDYVAHGLVETLGGPE